MIWHLNVLSDAYPAKDENMEGIVDLGETLSCCGVANSSDWSALGAIPDSCCIESVTGCAKDLAPLHPGGCMDKVEMNQLLPSDIHGNHKTILSYSNDPIAIDK
ncbi:hypothetical protein TELCIR_19665 [Teladorsagia circumcincta]|uniref:Uncharacterized protein n=1 Tax=Teladorsagia circumcincta TaxID=45464 RepID=A0A2G9TLY2_TELCI|nr:hypothetical protein TELCIR_19665 [Teladorsagia circumcincta]